MKLLIENGRLIDPASKTDGIRSIAIADGKNFRHCRSRQADTRLHS